MINPSNYFKILNDLDINFFTGVPDSLLKEFCACITASVAKKDHIISANEGSAIGIAIGRYLGTKKLPLVAKFWFRQCNQPNFITGKQ